MRGEFVTVFWNVVEFFKIVVIFFIFLMNDGGFVIKLDSVRRRGIFEFLFIIIKVKGIIEFLFGSLFFVCIIDFLRRF